jgi:DNA-binding NtrC family response regulator
MSEKEVPGPAPRFRLRGEVGGVERRYLLQTEGHARLGSVGDNDIVLPIRGVSKRHALLHADTRGLTLEDLGSKNGVLVNGTRVQRTLLNAGDEIRIGPVSLLLEVVAEGDADIAIVMHDAASAPQTGLPGGQTTTLTNRPGQPSEAIWLAVIEASLAEAGASPAAAGALLGALLRELSVESATLLEWDLDGTASVIAHRGRTPEPPDQHVIERLQKGVAADASVGRCSVAIEGDEPPLACAALRCSETRFLGLALRGEFRGREDSASLLRTLLRLAHGLGSSAREVATPPPDSGAAELVFPSGYVVGDSPAIRAVYRQLRPLLQGDLPVLLLGETGVGKEWLARILHASSSRREGPFVAVNCAAIPADLLEAELFGIGRGVATGVAEREGSFQRADGGTLFLDEIGDMSAGLQAKLLRALQEKHIQPVGGTPVAVEIRVVTATNTDLRARMDEGRFRRDLYFRVAGYALQIPPLRERPEDVPALAEAFILRFSEETGKTIRGLSVKALGALVAYPWPGNIRELEHEMRRLVYLCPGGEAIDSTLLSEQVLTTAPLAAPPAGEGSLRLDENVKLVEQRLIERALARAGGNRTRAAKLLGVSRNGLAIKMERLGIRG